MKKKVIPPYKIVVVRTYILNLLTHWPPRGSHFQSHMSHAKPCDTSCQATLKGRIYTHSHGVSPSSYSSSSSSATTCWMLVHAYATLPMKAKWSGPHQRKWEENKVRFHSVTCYTNSVLSRIHVSTRKLRTITCTLVATGVILRSLECTSQA